MVKETLTVQGMSCHHCVMTIEGSVGKMPGVSSVKVHLKEGKVDVEYDPNVTSKSKIEETIVDQGYEVVA
ncbi:MAG: copper chaperone CopZ [Thermicanus sp.]|nr:copper chaperone CopZ [Thermicanus sp.]